MDLPCAPLVFALLVAGCAGGDRLGGGSDPDPGTTPPGTTPVVCTPLALDAPHRITEVGGLLLLKPSGGSGDRRFVVTPSEAGAVSATGSFVAGDTPGAVQVAMTDAACPGEVSVALTVVSPMGVEPGSATLAPGVTLSFAVSGGSGEVTCALAAAEAGSTLSGAGAGCELIAGTGTGRDTVRFTDSATGSFVDVGVDIAPGTTFLTAGAGKTWLPVDATWTPVATSGSGALDMTVISGPFQVADGPTDGLRATADGDGEVVLLDRYTGQRLQVPVTGVAPLGPDLPRDGERTGQGEVVALGDVNGDGFGDVALGFVEPSVVAHQGGIVAIWAGTAQGFSANPVQVFHGARALAGTGRGLAVADVDQDGRLDLLIGSDGVDAGATNVGSVALHAAIPGGFFEPEPWRTLGGQVSYSRFGSAIATCDFDGDGALDLAVGAREESDLTAAVPAEDQGAVHVFWGGSGGLSDRADFLLFGELPDGAGGWVGAGGGRHGTSLAAADLDGDGRCDLAVGAPDGRVADGEPGDGGVAIYAGQASGVLSRHPVRLLQGPAGENAGFGRRLAVGDVDGDGAAELLVGAWKADRYADAGGAAWLFVGGDLGERVDRPVAVDEAAWVVHGEEDDDHVGSAVALQDWDGDGAVDAVVGAYRAEDEVLGAGKVMVYADLAATIGPGGTWDATLRPPTAAFEGARVDDRLGAALALVDDTDGDGRRELFSLAGLSSAHGVEAGAPYLLRTAGGSPVALALPGAPAGHEIGRGLAVVDLDGDGFDDLLLGAPGAGIEEVGANAGGIWVVRGGPTGPTGALVPWSPRLPSPGGGDRFGYAVAEAGDFDGDGFDDLAVVARGDSRPEVWGDDVVGTPACSGFRSLAGAVFVFRGAEDGVADAPSFVWYGPQESGGVYRLAAGFDHDGDGRGDLAVASPDEWSPGGGFAVLHGRPADEDGLTVLCDDDVFLAVDDFDRWGDALAGVGDLDGDGCDELAVGATGEELTDDLYNQGTIRILWGHGGRGCRPTAEVTTLASRVRGTGLGRSLAGGADLDGDGSSDLLAGGPEHLVTFSEFGGVWVSPGSWLVSRPSKPFSPPTLPVDAEVVWSAFAPDEGLDDTLGLLGTVAAGRFGEAVAFAPDPERPGQTLVVVAQPLGAVGGANLGGGLTMHRWEDGVGLDPLPWGQLVGEAIPEGHLGEQVLSTTVNGRPALVVAAPSSSARGVQVGAVYVVPL